MEQCRDAAKLREAFGLRGACSRFQPESSSWPTTKSTKKGTWEGLHSPSDGVHFPNRLFFFAFSAFSVVKLLRLGSHHPRLPTAPANWPHSTRFACQFVHQDAPCPKQSRTVRQIQAHGFSRGRRTILLLRGQKAGLRKDA